MNGYLRAARWCAAAGWILWIVVQWVADDPFPPEISLSQYGLGPHGWLFSLWVILLATSPLLLYSARPVPGPARWLLAMGYLGVWAMALVRTDEPGVAMSAHAKVHTFGAVLAMVFLPLGILSVLRYSTRFRALAGGLGIAAAVVGILVLLSAVGVDTAGLGAPKSWALWQGTMLIIEMALVTLYAVVVTTLDPGSVRAPATAPVKSAHQ
ncbi:MAG: DUF998 domain-containing protein [Nakamurella sp.]